MSTVSETCSVLKHGLFKGELAKNALESEKEEAMHPPCCFTDKRKRESWNEEIWGRDGRSVLLHLRILLS